MTDRPISLSVGGTTYRVLSDADPEALQSLAAIVDARIHACDPARRLSPSQALLYAALILAEDLDTEKRARQALQTQVKSVLTDILRWTDAAMESMPPITLTPPHSPPSQQP